MCNHWSYTTSFTTGSVQVNGLISLVTPLSNLSVKSCFSAGKFGVKRGKEASFRARLLTVTNYFRNNLGNEMSLFQKQADVFYNWDREVLRSLHHEDFMSIRETELLTLNEHVATIDELARKGKMDWHSKAIILNEDDFFMAARWEQEGDIITNVHLKKHGLSWRALVSRNPIN